MFEQLFSIFCFHLKWFSNWKAIPLCRGLYTVYEVLWPFRSDYIIIKLFRNHILLSIWRTETWNSAYIVLLPFPISRCRVWRGGSANSLRSALYCMGVERNGKSKLLSWITPRYRQTCCLFSFEYKLILLFLILRWEEALEMLGRSASDRIRCCRFSCFISRSSLTHFPLRLEAYLLFRFSADPIINLPLIRLVSGIRRQSNVVPLVVGIFCVQRAFGVQ